MFQLQIFQDLIYKDIAAKDQYSQSKHKPLDRI